MAGFNPDGSYRPDTPQDVEARYGFVGQMAKSVPELRGILDRATREQWTTERFIMEVSNTGWYRTHGADVREWQTLEATDPATAHMRKTHEKGNIAAIANEMGIHMTDAQLEQAFFMKQFGGNLSDQNFRNYLGRTFFDAYKMDWNSGTGLAAEYASKIGDMRHAYGMPDSDEFSWTRDALNQIMRGDNTVDGLILQAKAYAKTKYSAFTERIEAGETMNDIALPYMESYRRLLEAAPNTGLQDNQLQKALTFNEGGTAMSNWQFEQELRKDARWGKTTNAKESMADFITQLGQDWGFVGSSR